MGSTSKARPSQKHYLLQRLRFANLWFRKAEQMAFDRTHCLTTESTIASKDANENGKFTAFHSVPTQFIAPELKTFRQTPRQMQNATRVSVVSLQFLR